MLTRVLVAWLLAIPCTVAVSHADGTTSPGRESAFASLTEQTPLGQWPTDPLNVYLTSVSIVRGRAHRVLQIHATLTYRGTDCDLIGILPTVNGVGVEPFARSILYCQPAPQGFGGTVAGTWWLDLDAAEAANPGKFVNQALLVRLLGGEIASKVDAGPWDASLAVEVLKK
jgi:hypothetical protein